MSGVPEGWCGENEFRCAGGYCIMGYKRCNGIVDCLSGNDEEDCPPPTTALPGRSTFEARRANRKVSTCFLLELIKNSSNYFLLKENLISAKLQDRLAESELL